MIDILALMVIVVILSLVVYHISQYCTKETPFEQALAEQRQKRELETGPISSKNEKFHKKNKPMKKIKPKKDENEASSVKEGLAHSVKNQTQIIQANKKVQQEISKTNKNKLAEEDTKITPILSDNQDIKKDIKKKKDVIKEEKDETINVKLEDASDKKTKQLSQQPKGTNAIPLSVKASLIGQPAVCKVDVETNDKIAGKDSTTQQLSSKSNKNATNGKGAAKQNVPVLTDTKDVRKIKLKSKEASVVVQPVVSAVKEYISPKPSKTSPSSTTKSDSHESLSRNNDQSDDITFSKLLVLGSIPMKVKNKVPKESDVVMEQLEVIGSQIQNDEKKKKKEKPEEKKVKLNVAPDDALTRLLPIINKSHLSGGEIQMLIDSLLNKQQLTGNQGGDWVEKGRIDPIKEFKRQLEEVDSKLKEQSETNKALSTKIIDMRTELNSERTRSSNYRKQLEASESGCQIKLESAANLYRDNLNAKINDCKIAMEKEFQAKFIKQQQGGKAEAELVEQQLRSKLAEVEQQFQHEKSNCTEAVKIQQQTQIALEELQQQLNQLMQNKNDFVEKCQQYQQHVSVLEDQLGQQETAYNARMAEMQLSLSASEETLSQTMKQLNHSVNEIDQLKVQLKNFENLRELQTQNLVKLKETQNEKSDLESRLLSNEKDLSKLRELVNDQKIQIECLIEEKESLASQSVRPAAEGQENGDIHNEQKEQITSNLNEMYEEQISSLTKEVSKLKDDIIYQRIKNDELRTKNHKVLEALSSTEEILRTRLKRHDEETGKWEKESKLTRQVLLRLFPSVNVSENLDHSSFLKQIETAAVAAQTAAAAEVKPQIIEKIVEMIVQDPSLVKQLEEMKLQNEDLQKKIELQNEEKLSLESKKSSGEEQTRRITALEIENKSLEGRIVYYQDVLSNTETLLKTLESSVESEEASWKEKLVQKEEVIQQLNADKINLTLRTSELQAALDKVQQAEEMESQMNALKDKLNKEEIEKTNLKEQLQIVQEQLKVSNLSQAALNAYKAGSMGYMMSWITNNNSFNNMVDKASSNTLPPLPRVTSLAACVPTYYSSPITSPTFVKIFNGIQTLNSNGPPNGLECPEDDSVSLVSASSVSEGNSLPSNLEGTDSTNKKKKKKKIEGSTK